MSKPLVEKFEQMLAEDPKSTAFVELARALIDRGDNDRAMQVCEQGLTHHPGHVVGRVLLGKALINAGRAAEAMTQFDRAIHVEKDNPHAYNLISELLLRKGLYRSALPILRKAVALQPTDARIKQWMEQTKAALAGGPAPVLYDSTTVDALSLDAAPQASTGAPVPAASVPTTPYAPVVGAPPPAVTAPGVPGDPTSGANAMPDLFAAFAQRPIDPSVQPTVVTQAYPPGKAPATTVPEMAAVAPGAKPAGNERPTTEVPLAGVAAAAEGRFGPRAGAEAPDPFAALTRSAENADTVSGLTGTFNALEEGAGAPIPAPARSSPSVPSASEPSVAVSEELLRGPFPVPSPPARPSGPPGLLDDVVSVQSEVPTGEISAPPSSAPDPSAAFAPRPSAPKGPKSLLDDIPDEAPVVAPVTIPRGKHGFHEETIAREYEAELRKKLEVSRQKKTFLQRNGLMIGVLAVLLVVGGGLGGSFLYTRVKHKGENLDSSVGKGLAALTADTKEQYLAALEAFGQALEMDDSSKNAWAYSGFAHAVLFAEHGREASHASASEAAWARPGVRDAHADLAAVSDYLLADPSKAKEARAALLDSALDASAVNAQVGRLLLDDRKYEDALKRLSKAVEQDSHNVRALVALGDYYLAFEDFENAYTVLSGPAAQLSKTHPLRVIGLAQARLELSREVQEALSELEALPKAGAIPAPLVGRYTLWHGRAQAANGKIDDAQKTLEQGLVAAPAMAFDFHMALGQSFRSAGLMEKAQREFEAALKVDGKSEAAKEGLGRALLARSREKELLDRLKAEKDQRKISLVRGIAYSRLGDVKKARAELNNTQVGGKYPAEAVVYLALADAAEESQGDKAVQALEKLAGQIKRNKATVQVALARVYMQKNQLDKARAQLEEAAKDPQDYEGNALLGELLVNAGVPSEVAVEPLLRAVERNGSHAPARHLLTRMLLDLGKVADAQKQIDAWLADNPALELAWRDSALVHYQAGRLKEAEGAILKGLKPDSDDLEGWRLKARIFFARGDAKSAFAALERANRLNSKDAETFCEIGNAFVRQGVPEMALKAYEAALREEPKSVCGKAGAFHAFPTAKGRAAVQGLLKDSKRAWEKAFLYATLARSQAEAGAMKDARQSVDEALQLAPGSPLAWFAAGEVAKKSKDAQKALESYQKAAELEGTWTAPHLMLADELAKAGKESWPKAITEYELVASSTQSESEQSRASKNAQALRKQLK